MLWRRVVAATDMQCTQAVPARLGTTTHGVAALMHQAEMRGAAAYPHLVAGL